MDLQIFTYYELVKALKTTRQESGGIPLDWIAKAFNETFDEAETKIIFDLIREKYENKTN